MRYLYEILNILYRFAIDLGQDGHFSSQVSQAEAEEVIDDERLIAAPNRIKVHGVTKEDEAQPRTEAVDRDDEENTHNPQLLIRE